MNRPSAPRAGPLRLLVFAQQISAFRSGVGTYAYGLVSGLLARGHRLTLALPRDTECPFPGVELIPVARKVWDPTPQGWLGLGKAFAGILHSEGRNHHLAHFINAQETLFLGDSPVPVTSFVHDSYALDWAVPGYPRALFADRLARGGYYRLLRELEARAYRKTPFIMANSRHVARSVVRGYRLDPARVGVVHYGLPLFPPAPPSSLEGTPPVLFAGGNFQRKGLGILLEAVARLSGEFPGMTVHVVGKDRNQGVFEALARRLGIGDRVAFHGWLPNQEVRGMMAGAGVFAMPSFTEGFGLVYLEAMLAGTPVVATSAGGLGEEFVDGREALFVPPGDPGALARALARIAGDQAAAAALREAGRNRAADFTVEAMTEKTERVFRGLLAGGDPSSEGVLTSSQLPVKEGI